MAAMNKLHLGWISGVDTAPPPALPAELLPEGLSSHTAIIAQSGSGKSFLLGRLIEELILKTRAKVLILDPNAEFVRLNEINRDSWKSKATKRLFDAEDTLSNFRAAWAEQHFMVASNRPGQSLDADESDSTLDWFKFRIDWGKLSTAEKSQYLGFTSRADPVEVIMVDLAERVAKSIKAGYRMSEYLKALSRMRQVSAQENIGTAVAGRQIMCNTTFFKEPNIVRVLANANYLSKLAIWQTSIASNFVDRRLTKFLDSDEISAFVLDLPSIRDTNAQLVASHQVLSLLWERSRENWATAVAEPASEDERVPIFIVIDEAHNLAPQDADGETRAEVREKIAQIAAEGRKYGLFLILVSQRPSKLHMDVLSQCDNLCLMRMNNRLDLELIENTFGFLPENRSVEARDFKLGEALLAGRFVPQVTRMQVAPRRTVEGGRSLDTKYWATL